MLETIWNLEHSCQLFFYFQKNFIAKFFKAVTKSFLQNLHLFASFQNIPLCHRIKISIDSFMTEIPII